MTDNPLLSAALQPAFDLIRPDHVEPAIEAALTAHASAMEKILSTRPRTFASVFLPREAADLALGEAWSLVGHLKSVMDAPALRAAHDAMQSKVLEYLAKLNQNPDLLAALEDVLSDAPGPVERRAVELALRDLRMAGVALQGAQRQRFADISVELGTLTSAFGEAVLDATNAWSLNVTDETWLAGVPDSERSILVASAREAGEAGWRLTLHAPAVRAILTFAESRRLRAIVYGAYQIRASEQGPGEGRFDNSERIRRILALRREKATLLGLDSPAAYSLATKMAPGATAVLEFLRDIARQARPLAESELEDARNFARETLGYSTLEPWDLAFVSERMRQILHALDEAEVKQYLPIDRVIGGMFGLLNTVFGVTFTEVANVPVWHPDVRYYALSRGKGEPFAGVYFDLHARRGKNGGAWMGVCRARFDGETFSQRPVAYLTCNFAPLDASGVGLLTHDDLLTLLHEMGHCLHHLLGEVSLPSIGGISGFEWDAVELPSQLMEHFGWDPKVLATMSGHVETGEPLPETLIRRMLAARGFQAGLSALRQIEFSLFDLELHLSAEPIDETLVAATLDKVREEVAVVTPPDWTRMPHAFTHIFDGGYAAGYYSYLWAERLSADGFEQFEELGYAKAGEAFRTEVLSRGAGRPAAESYRAFRGREPSNAALLRSRGLTPYCGGTQAA